MADDKTEPVVLALKSTVTLSSTKGVRAYAVQLVDGVTKEEVARLVQLALAAERRVVSG